LVFLTLFLGSVVDVALGQDVKEISVVPNPVIAGQTVTGTLSLTKAAPTQGLKIKLSSSSASADVPPTVTVAPGESAANFSISTELVKVATKLTVKAIDPAGKSAEATLTIEPPAVRVTALTLTPTSVEATKASSGEVTLSSEAPSGAFTVKLSSQCPAISIPASVVVKEGAKSANFSITTTTVSAKTPAAITVSDGNGYAQSAVLTIDLPSVRVTGLKVANSAVTAANPTTATITLSSDAPKGGFVVSLVTPQTFITIPSSITIKSGSKTATFTIVTSPVSTAGTASITATDAIGYSTQASLTVNIPAVRLSSLVFSPNSVVGGNTTTGYITLSAPAGQSGFTVNLSTMQSAVLLPMTVQFSPGSSTTNFAVTTNNVASTINATVLATDGNGYSAKGVLTLTQQLNPGAVSITPNYRYAPQSTTVAAGSTVTWTNDPNGNMVHTVTPDISTPGMDSGTKYPDGIPLGASFSWTVPANAKSGTAYYYHCIYHGIPGNGKSLGTGMAGVIFVK
jgi:plastocyanin